MLQLCHDIWSESKSTPYILAEALLLTRILLYKGRRKGGGLLWYSTQVEGSSGKAVALRQILRGARKNYDQGYTVHL